MTTQQTALENLRIIRSLMEKAHIYRAISAPAALIGGCLALGVAIWGSLPLWSGKSGAVTPNTFLALWLAVLLITAILNTILLARDAASRQQIFFSDDMRMALRAFLPPMMVGGVVGIGLIVYLENMTLAALIWILCYGLALVATGNFSPRSLVRLGWSFVIFGLAMFWAWASNSEIRLLTTDSGPASVAMALSFGMMHIGYGLAVTLTKKPEAAAE